MRIGQRRAALHQGDASIGEQLFVDTFEARDLAVLGLDQCRPRERGLGNGPAVAARILNIFVKVRCVHQQFFWHAATNHAGATGAV